MLTLPTRIRIVRQIRLLVASFIFCALVYLCAPPFSLSSSAIAFTPAAAGDLDTTFGNGGRVVTSFPGGLDTATKVLIQTDGKLIVVGSSGSDFALARFNTNGSLDPTFGTGGTVHTNFPNILQETAKAAALQSDGKIVVVGVVGQPFSSLDSAFALVRYNSDGSLDPTFGTAGHVFTVFAGRAAEANAVVLQLDGKIVVAGAANILFSRFIIYNYALARYNPDGSLDNTFGTGGQVTTESQGEANGVAIQSDGKIVIGSADGNFALARYNTDGTLDTTFGTGGKVSTDFNGGGDGINQIAIQSDGKIIAAGQTARSGDAANADFALARYNPDGSLDTTFNETGKVITDFGLSDVAKDVKLQSDGKIVAAGYAIRPLQGSYFFALARYNPNGSLDTSFDGDGLELTDTSGGRFNLGIQSIALQTDGRIVVAGDINSSGQRDFGVIRYNTDGSFDASFGTSGQVTLDFPLNDDLVTALLRQADGKIIAVGHSWLQFGLFEQPTGAPDGRDPNFQIARYNTDGSLDPTYGMNGLVATGFGRPGSADYALGAALQSDGKLVVVGSSGSDFALARYNPNGSLDTSFDGDGLTTFDFGVTKQTAHAVAVQPDGKIVVAGIASLDTVGTSSVNDFALARLNPDGSLDSTFGSGGKVKTDLNNAFDGASTVAIQSDGKIVVAGVSNGDFALARYNTDGTLDTTFGSGGLVTTDFNGGYDGINQIAIQSDGRIVAAGWAAVAAGSSSSDFALARYNTDGSLDMNFGTGGKVTTDFGGRDQANSVALQSNGRIVAAGLYSVTTTLDTGGASNFFALARYNPNGSLDTTFGASGKVTTDFFGINNQANAVLVQPDNKIVAGGFTNTGSSFDFALARYQVAAAATPTPTPPPVVAAQFSAVNYPVSESAQSVVITVTLSAPALAPGTVNYATAPDTAFVGCDVVNGIASERCDFTTTLGTLRFSAGEQMKSFQIFITDDAYVDGTETFGLSLSNATGGLALGTLTTATVTITDNDSAPTAPNPIDNASFFVNMHYVDFLNRLGESAGVNAWVNQLNNCPANGLTCDRVETSSRFFRSDEFMLKGAFVIHYYKVSLGTNPNYRDFTRDSERVTGATAAEVNANRDAFMNEWVERADFKAMYDALSNQAYVDKLEQTAGVTLSNKAQLVNNLNTGAETRAQVLRDIVESSEVKAKMYNDAFVLMEYFGYLRRDAEAAGFQAWLNYLNAHPTDYRTMVNGFVNSIEYRKRFGRT